MTELKKVAQLVAKARQEKLTKTAAAAPWLKKGWKATSEHFKNNPTGQSGFGRKLDRAFRYSNDPNAAISWKRVAAVPLFGGATYSAYKKGKSIDQQKNQPQNNPQTFADRTKKSFNQTINWIKQNPGTTGGIVLGGASLLALLAFIMGRK